MHMYALGFEKEQGGVVGGVAGRTEREEMM